MPKKLVGLILRHGETTANRDKLFRSWIDFPLDDNGIRQANDAAGFLKKFPIKHIICSPLLRAFVTADIASKQHKVQVYQHRGLFPWRLGFFSGLSRDENEDGLRLFVQNPSVTVPGGESLADFEDRSFAFWKAALKLARENGLTLYVAHTSNCVALGNFTEGSKEGEPEFSDTVQPGGIAAIYFDGKQHSLEVIFGEEKTAKFGGS